MLLDPPPWGVQRVDVFFTASLLSFVFGLFLEMTSFVIFELHGGANRKRSRHLLSHTWDSGLNLSCPEECVYPGGRHVMMNIHLKAHHESRSFSSPGGGATISLRQVHVSSGRLSWNECCLGGGAIMRCVLGGLVRRIWGSRRRVCCLFGD